MLKLTLRLMLLLIALTSLSCKKGFPSIEPQVRCVNVLLDEKVIEGVPYYSGYCRCHLYEWTASNIGRVSDSTNYELQKCNKLIGFEPDTYTKVWTWWEDIRLFLNRQRK